MDCDVLVVGAGPTGLTLAAALDAMGASVRLVDRAYDRVRESRALVVQPRTLEVLRDLGLAEDLVGRGNPAVQLRIDAGGRAVQTRLFDLGLEDTAFPFLLFVSQAETEAVLGERLRDRGVLVERGVEFLCSVPIADGVECRLRSGEGRGHRIRARYLVGCDGAHSSVREQAGVRFAGGRYPQTFVLADLEVAGLEAGAVHAFVTDHGPLLFFPLGRPAPWRLIAVRPGPSRDAVAASPEPRHVPVADLQALCEHLGAGHLRVGDPVWSSVFHVHHRHAETYRAGRAFLAGDAAHIHSPAGGQGMNTGMQDAWNLGWKLALVCRGLAPEELLESYDAERRPVGRFVLRFTDRAFTAATSTTPLIRLARTQIVPHALPLALRVRRGRAMAFRTVSQLGIRYRGSPAVHADRRQPAPRAGDRLPDARVSLAGRRCWLHEALREPAFHLLLCGPPGAWDAAGLHRLHRRFGELLRVHHLSRQPGPGVIHDVDGSAYARLRLRGPAQLVVRPDGHLGYRGGGTQLADAVGYLERWLGRGSVGWPGEPSQPG